MAVQAKEDFSKMLEESDELTEGMRWGSKVAKIFEHDSRWKVRPVQPSLKHYCSSAYR